MVSLTRKQRVALNKKHTQNTQNMSYRQFRKTVQGTILMDNAVVVCWSGMFLAIETDGYTHS